MATLLTVIGEEAQVVFSMFTEWTKQGDDKKMELVLVKFAQYSQPCKNVSFSRFHFNCCTQKLSETNAAQY